MMLLSIYRFVLRVVWVSQRGQMGQDHVYLCDTEHLCPVVSALAEMAGHLGEKLRDRWLLFNHGPLAASWRHFIPWKSVDE